ncbi:MAG: hypothetical protein ACI8SE_000451, partial [Bacteroidia bacterium]
MKNVIRYSLALLSLIGVNLDASAQTYPIEINLNMSSPYPTNYDAYMDHLSKGFVQVTNSGIDPLEVYFKLSFKENNGRLRVTSPLDLTNGVTILPGVNILTEQNIIDMFSGVTESDFYTAGLTDDQRQAVIINKQLPEGSYTLCVYAYDENQKLISDPFGMGCSEFDLYYAERPIIDQPMEGEGVFAMESVNIVWSQYLTSVDALSRTEYVVKIIDITEQEIRNIPNAFLDPGISPDYEENVGSTRSKFIQNNIELPLVLNHVYAVRVTAVDPLNEVLYQHGGHSEIVVFTYGEKEDENKWAVPTLVRPTLGDEITVGGNLPIQWTHDIDDASKVRYNLIVIDQTASKNGYTIDYQDILDKKYEFVVNRGITSKDTIISTSGDDWVDGHDYLIIVQALSDDESIEFLQFGLGGLVSVQYGITPEKEPKKPEVAKVKPDKTKKTKPSEGNCDPELLTKLPKNKDSLVSVKLEKKTAYQFGKLTLEVTSKDGGIENGYTGKGFIKVKLGDQNVKVNIEFLELKVNKGGRVIAGRGSGILDDLAKELGDMNAIVQGVTGMDSANIMKLYTYGRNEVKNERINRDKDVNLPIGIGKRVGSEVMIVSVVDMQLTPERATMAALFTMTNRSWGKHIPVLGADQICFTPEGPGDNVRLYLVNDFTVPGLRGDMLLKASKNDGKGKTEGTYVLMNKSGFVKGQLSAEFGISTKELYSENIAGVIDRSKTVKLFVSGSFKASNDFILQARIAPFQFPSLPDFGFNLENGFYDNSDVENPPNIKFPEGHPTKGSDVTWKGVWFSKAQIRAPRDWGGSSKTEGRTSASVSFIKDNFGVHLKAEIDNILDIKEGEVEGFAFSIDNVTLHVLNSKFQAVTTIGQIGLPILPDGKYLDYLGSVDQPKADSANQKQPLSIAYTITPDKKGYDIDWLKAHIDFDSSTYFLLKNDGLEKGMDIQMNGVISVKASLTENMVDLPGLKFSGMQLKKMTYKDPVQAQADPNNGKLVFTGPTFAFTSTKEKGGSEEGNDIQTNPDEKAPEGKLTGFNFQVKKLKLEMGGMRDFSLSVDAEVGLVKTDPKNTSQGKGISARGKFNILGSISGNQPKDMSFKYKEITVDALSIHVDVSAIRLEGNVEFYRGDEVMGDGFKGDLNVKTPIVEVQLEAIFGNKQDYEYWYVYGKVGKAETGKKPGSPIWPKKGTPSMLKLWGFGGGAYYHMTDNGKDATRRYTPNKRVDLGLKASVTLSVTEPDVFWADAELSAEFGDTTRILLSGNAYFMKKEMTPNESGKVDGVEAILKAKVNMAEDYFDLASTMDVRVNLQNGTFKGDMEDKPKFTLATATLNVTQKDWKFWVGQPTNRGEGIMNMPVLGEVEIKAYLMMGTEDMEAAIVPTFISTMLGASNSGFSSSGMAADSTTPTRDSSGQGVAFGAELYYTFYKEIAILYIDFKAMLGFDFSLINGNKACSNILDAAGDPIAQGVDGWYGKGQVYAGFRGDMGLYIDLFFFSGKISLVTLNAAMLIEGGTPNPTFVKGTASMGYSVLGGIVKGRTSFNLSAGNQCDEEVIDPFAGIDFIASMTPGDETRGAVKKVSVFAKPAISFNEKVGENAIYIFEEPNTKRITKYRVRVDSFHLRQSKGWQLYAEGKEERPNIYELQFTPKEILLPQTAYYFEITLVADELTKNGWIPVRNKKTKKLWSITEGRHFITGDLPNKIVYDNLVTCYPGLVYSENTYIPDYRYLQSENKKKEGFIQFKRTTDYLFKKTNDPESVWWSEVVAVFRSFDSGSYSDLGETKIVSGKGHFLVFKLPEENLPNNTMIQIDFNRKYYRNPKFKFESESLGEKVGNIGDTIVRKGKAYTNYPLSDKSPESEELWSFVTVTSKFNTFSKKIQNYRDKSGTFNEVYLQDAEYYPDTYKRLVYDFGFSTEYGEPFSGGEMMGNRIRIGDYPIDQNVHFKEDYSKGYYTDLFNTWHTILANFSTGQIDWGKKHRWIWYYHSSDQSWNMRRYVTPRNYDFNSFKPQFDDRKLSSIKGNGAFGGYKMFPMSDGVYGSSVLLN